MQFGAVCLEWNRFPERCFTPWCLAHVGVYLQFDVNAHILTRARVIEQMKHGGDQSFVDATQLAINHTLQDGAEASASGHHLWVLQSCEASRTVKKQHDQSQTGRTAAPAHQARQYCCVTRFSS